MTSTPKTTAPVGGTPDRPSDPVAVVTAVYQALAANDLDTLARLSSPDIVVVQSEKLPYGGTFHGPEGTRAFTVGVFQALDSTVEIGAVFAAGDAVVQIGRTSGTSRATGKPFDSPEVHVWTVHDGLVTSLHAYVDAAIIGDAMTP